MSVEHSSEAAFLAAPPAQEVRRIGPRRQRIPLGGDGLGERTASSLEIPRIGLQVAPLSRWQESFWALERLGLGENSAYHVPRLLHLRGPLNVSALEKALTFLVERHEILRTTYHEREGTPVQQVEPVRPIALQLENLRGLSSEARRASAGEWVLRESRTPFDLHRGPVLRARLLQLAEDEHQLLLVTHHVASDGWSREVLFRELLALYEAAAAGRVADLPLLPIQYADVAAWEHRTRDEARLQADVEFWRRRLEGSPSLLSLPTDFPRRPGRRNRGERAGRQFAPGLADTVHAFCRMEGVTQFSFFLTAFQGLLARWSGQSEVVVGTSVSDRPHPDTERLIGPFVSTLPLRADLSAAPTFRGALRRAREAVLDAYEHRSLPFEQLVAAVNPVRVPGATPLFQAMLFVEPQPEPLPEAGGVCLTELEVDRGAGKTDLILTITTAPGALHASLEYDPDLYTRATAERLLAQFEELIDSATARPDLSLAELNLVPEWERQELFALAAPEGVVPAEVESVARKFAAQVRRTPQAVAVSGGADRLTYRQLDDCAERLALALRNLGVSPGDRVGLLLDRTPLLLAAVLAVWKAGASYVPLDPAYPQERSAAMLVDAGVSLLLTGTEGADLAPRGSWLTAHVHEDGTLDCIGQLSGSRHVSPDGSDPEAYVIFTSGSTGRPKGVQIGHRSLGNLLDAMQEHLGLREGDALPALASHAFDMSVPELFLPLVTGARVILVPREISVDGTRLLQLLQDATATVLHATPATWALLLDAGLEEQGAGCLRYFCAGAESVPVAVARRLLRLGRPLRVYYGPTETTVWSTSAFFQAPEELDALTTGWMPIGRQLPNTEVWVLDPQRQLAPLGTIGELYLGGMGLSTGYVNQPDLTVERFVPHPFCPGARLYRTGDLVRWRRGHSGEMELEFWGRMDHQVKLRGFRIELGEVEAVLGEHPLVRECVAVLWNGLGGDPELVAYVALVTDAVITASDLRQFLRVRLPDYAIPGRFVIVDALPRSANGKLDRRRLPDPAAAASPVTQFIEPRNSLESAIAEHWSTLLGVPRVGAFDDFFALGGHSLLATRSLSYLRDLLGLELSLGQLFQAPTVAGFAEIAAEQLLSTADLAELDLDHA